MKQYFKILALTLGIVLTAAPLLADYQTGLAAYKLRHFKWAMKEFKADQTSESHYILGTMYFKGEGVNPDPAEGIEWFKKAAGKGHAQAQYVLGIIYYEGKDVIQDRTAAAKWFRFAAERGHLQAQFYLGLMYYNGEGVEKDRNKSLLWLKKAAVSGNWHASQILKTMGEEVPPQANPAGSKIVKRPLTIGAPSVLPMEYSR